MVGALKALGFKRYTIRICADLTIMEEANELIGRLKMVAYYLWLQVVVLAGLIIWNKHGDMLDYPSTCKSPQQMFGAIAKTY